MSALMTPLSFRSVESTESPVYSIRTNYSIDGASLLEGDSLAVPFRPRLVVANGLKSELFKPLVTALFKGNKLKKETILNTDLESLCVAVLETTKTEESPFRIVGYHIKGLCIILSHKLKILSQDLAAYMKKILTIDKIKQPEKRPKYYESDDEYVVVRKRKRKVKEKILRLEDKYDEEIDIPIERIEMLQMMNLGIGMGIGTELAFYDAKESTTMDRAPTELSPLVFEYFKEFSSITSMEDLYNSEFAVNEKSWLEFDDLRMLTSPFKLNAYSYTPTPVSTIVASSVGTSEKSYELDWGIYNDPLNYANKNNSLDYTKEIDTWSESTIEPVTLALPAAPSRLSIGDLTMVKSDHKYDKRVQMKRVARRKGTPRPKILALEPSDEAIARPKDPLVRGVERESSWKDVVSKDTVLRETITQAVENLYSKYIERGVANTEKISVPKPVVHNRSNQVDKRTEPERTTVQHITCMNHLSRSEEIGTIQVLDAYREYFRENKCDVVNFSNITKGYNKRAVSLVFFRTLLLANSNFVNLEQMEDIKVVPGKRFWEPVVATK